MKTLKSIQYSGENVSRGDIQRKGTGKKGSVYYAETILKRVVCKSF